MYLDHVLKVWTRGNRPEGSFSHFCLAGRRAEVGFKGVESLNSGWVYSIEAGIERKERGKVTCTRSDQEGGCDIKVCTYVL